MANISSYARRQLADYDGHHPGGMFAGDSVSITVEEAYRVQIELARLRLARGEPLAGYKIGCISQAIQTQMGLSNPVFGHVFGTEVHRSGATLNPALYDGLAIEGEFGLRLAEDIPDVAWLREHTDRAVAACFAVIELHNYVFRKQPPTAQELIANNAVHAGVVLPLSEGRLNQIAALLEEPISVFQNGQPMGAATGSALPGGPLGTLEQLVERLAAFGMHPRRGQIILTGSPLPIYPVSPGDRIEVKCEHLETVEAVVGGAS